MNGMSLFKVEKVLTTSAIALAVLPCIAHAENGFKPYAEVVISADDNLLRLHDSARALTVTGSPKMSDTFVREEVGIHAAELISEQNFTADLSLNRSNYNHFSQLNNSGKLALGNWNWHLGKTLEGNIGASFNESLAPLEDFRVATRNMRVQKVQNAELSWRLHPSWRFNAGYNHYTLNYDLAALRNNDRTLDSSQFGLDYIASSGSSMGLLWRHVRGSFPEIDATGASLFNNSYSQDELKAKIDWQFTPITKIQFLGGEVQKKHDVDASRDFSGFNARLSSYWSATDALRFNGTVWREIGAMDDLTVNFALNRGISAGYTWDIAPKVSIDGNAKWERRNYNNFVATGSTLDRVDSFKEARMSVSYYPIRHLKLGFSLFRNILDSNASSLAYAANGARINFRYDFGLEK